MNVEKNINKLIIANFLTGFVLWYGIEKLFMQEIGITPFGIGLNAVVFLIIIVLFDAPSGVLADRWNRKYTLMLALGFLTIGTLILGISNGLYLYLFGTALYGFYFVLTSGTFQAIIYDSLHEIGKQDQYDKYQGKAYAFFLVGVATSSLVGGYVSEAFGYRWAYYITILFSVMALIAIFSLVEPKFHKLESDSKLATHIIAIPKQNLQFLLPCR